MSDGKACRVAGRATPVMLLTAMRARLRAYDERRHLTRSHALRGNAPAVALRRERNRSLTHMRTVHSLSRCPSAPQSGGACVPTQSVGTRLEYLRNAHFV